MSDIPSNPPPPQSGGNRTTIIIAVVVILLLCCCCLLIFAGYVGWQCGDYLLGNGPIGSCPLPLGP